MYSGKITMEEREKLYNEVWEEPTSTLCKKYGISDNGLRKRCMKADIPLPPRGYWAKLAAGKEVTKSPLPKELSQMAKMNVSGYAVSYQKTLRTFTEEELCSEVPLFIYSDETSRILNCIRDELEVPARLQHPHLLVDKHKEQMESRRKHDKMGKEYRNSYRSLPDE